ncbi:GLPGLI family protein [Chishuiella sp.]|uniref:GLPGLI family protein n=1 Tax=Chishuiella sp. TaxID=1969467 RepID=UPI0028B0B612|nr:GLPGLI family protein [Chishuiella sp.]
MKLLSKKIFFIIFLSFAFQLYGQNKLYVEYDVRIYDSTIGILIADKTSSFYEEGLTTNKNKESMGKNMFSSGDFTHSIVYQNIKKPEINYIQTEYNDEDYFIKDSISTMKWELSSSEKTIEIQGYKCNEAKLNFRGSTYVAYYTNQIPTTFGPWKFKGLPGLILKVESQENPTIYWRATKIIYPYTTDKKLSVDLNKFKLSLKDYIKYEDSEDDAQSRALAAKSYGAIYVQIPDDMRREKSRERKYEWETW